MNRQTFDKIIDLINKNKTLSKENLYGLISHELKLNQSFDLNINTFTSIYGNFKRRQMFKSSDSSTINWRRLKDNSINLSQNYVQKCENDLKKNSIQDMANEIGIAPVLMVRLILDGLIKQDKLELVEKESIKNKDKISISFLIRETHLLKDGRLASEILECCFMDEDYGPSIDLVKNLIGIEYESKLEQILVQHGIVFIKENELREKGFDKTPDFKLEIPICLNNGALISWIDSKATFGDEQSHSEYYENQFKFYLNRFGSGLVIYWFGYLKEIEKLNFNSNFISIRDSFPTDFTQLNLSELI